MPIVSLISASALSHLAPKPIGKSYGTEDASLVIVAPPSRGGPVRIKAIYKGRPASLNNAPYPRLVFRRTPPWRFAGAVPWPF